MWRSTATGQRRWRRSPIRQIVAYCEARGQQIINGSYEYVLRKENGGLRIAQKKILLLEYVIDGYFDFFTI